MFARQFATQNEGYSETLYNVNRIAVGGFAEPHRQFDGTSREYAPTVRIDNVEVHLSVGAICFSSGRKKVLADHVGPAPESSTTGVAAARVLS